MRSLGNQAIESWADSERMYVQGDLETPLSPSEGAEMRGRKEISAMEPCARGLKSTSVGSPPPAIGP